MGSLVTSKRLTSSVVRRWLAIVSALAIGGCQVSAQLPLPTDGRQKTRSRSVIVQLFEWPWADIAQECETWLGPKGYGAVQISPPHEHPVIAQDNISFPWYQRYQTPVSYKLSSRSGNRSDLAEMISHCHKAGVNVYADVVINHITSNGASEAASNGANDGVSHGIGNIDDAPQALNMASETVQVAISNAMNELLALGVAGFHIDSAEHIPPQHLTKILRRLHPLNTKFHRHGGRPFVYQEVSNTDSTQASDYFGNGAVTEFAYGRNLGEQVRHGALKNLMLFGQAWGLMPSHKAVVFTDNHSTQRSRDLNIVTFYSPADDGARYRLANVFMLAWPYGTPKIMSSYDWPREIGNWFGPPADEKGQTLPVSCGTDWVCEHRWTEIANMVEFRNVTKGVSTVNHWWDNGNNQIAFARGSRGFVVINNENKPLSETLMTGLPSGSYCNVLAPSKPITTPDSALTSCDIPIVVDIEGKASFKVPPLHAVAIHIMAQH
ncbi:MAG: alpha-amylase family protein [Leptolyngbyaceae cyanobacterium MAG.088]|nr:alpha-amylase family protein [Leptolyngbyaceae cyanobacterium MAG.088]